MAGVGWQQMLELATSERDVVQVARDFVATLEPHEVARLPAVCRPAKFFSADDVTSFAFDVIRHDCDGDLETRELVHRIANFFSQASIRLSTLLARSNDEEQQSA